MSSVLSMMLPNNSLNSFNRLELALNQSATEFFNCQLNIIKSIDGHTYIGKEHFIKNTNSSKAIPTDENEH